MNNEKMELNMEEMEKVSGGYVVDEGTGNKFWVVRQDASVIAPAPTLEKAIEFAKAFSVSTTVMDRAEYKKRFGRDLEW